MAHPETSNSSLLQSNKLHLLLAKILIFFLLILPRTECITFSFSSFDPQSTDIVLENDASMTDDGVLHVTRVSDDQTSSVGRATYSQPLQIYDSKTGRLNDFTTHFSFAIKEDRPNRGDGMTFFMAPVDSKIPPNSGGGFLGLFTSTGISEEKIVAIEFDSYVNEWDPGCPHFGFDIHSIQSVAFDPWLATSDGLMQNAWLSYTSLTKNLTLIVDQPNGPNYWNTALSFVVDLRDFLPELVRFGFSGSNGIGSESHDIFSWEFGSSF